MMMCIFILHYAVKVNPIFDFTKEKLEIKQKAIDLILMKHI